MKQETPLFSSSTLELAKRTIDDAPHALLIVGEVVGNEKEVSDWVASAVGDQVISLGGITIEDVRELQGAVRTTSGHSRAVTIHNLDAMQHEAQNALLKLLEEPASNTSYVLSAQTLNGVLRTIRSRCRLLRLSQPTNAEYEAYYSDAPAKDVQAAIRATGGGVSDVSAYLNGETSALQTAKEIISKQPYQRLAYISKLAADKDMALQVLRSMQGVYRYLMERNPSAENSANKSLRACLNCEERLRKNGQAKLLLAELFIAV